MRAQYMFNDYDLDCVSKSISPMIVFDNPEIVYVPKIEHGFTDINYKEVCDTSFIIRLETTDECIIGKVSKISLFNDTIYVLDKNQSLFMFNPEGKFISKIGNKGQGPGEYVEPTDYFVDNKIYIWDNWQNKISIYNKNGKFLFDKIVPFMSFQIGKIDSDTFIFRAYNNYNLHIPQLDDYCIWTTDTSFNIQKSGLFYPYDSKNFVFDDNGMDFLDNYVTIYEKFSDSLFFVTNSSKLQCRYVLHFDGKRYLDELKHKNHKEAIKFYNTNNDCIQIMHCTFNDKYVVIQLFEGRSNIKTILYSSKSKKTIQFDAVSFNNEGGMFFMAQNSKFYNNYLVTCSDANYLTHQTQLSKYVGGDFSDIKEDDNPILIFYKLK